jgi:hypothetical protein
MKTLFIILAVILVIAFVIQKVMAAGNAKLERQAYRLISKDGNFELRDYPCAVMATVRSPRSGEDRAASSNFRRLANYIFGGNASSSQIAMTAPVHMRSDEKGNTMQFVMPSKYTLEDLPKPLDPSITFSLSDSGHYAAIIFGGFATENRIKEKEQELSAWMKEKGMEPIGPYEVLGYNPPYELVGRRNEIIVPTELKSK